MDDKNNSEKNSVEGDGKIRNHLTVNQESGGGCTVEVENRLKLKKELGVVYGVAVITGLIIGGGIYISPQAVLRHAGSPAMTILMWFLGGVFSIIGALCFAEIGVHFPMSGGYYVYLTELYGPYFGFMYLWQFILLVRCGSNALKTTLLATFLLKPLFPTCPIPSVAINCVSSFFTVLICVLNCTSVKLAAKSQTLMTMLSVATLLTISAVGFQQLASGFTENIENPFANSSSDPGDLVLAIYNTIFSYAGWCALNFIVEEVKNPKRTLPLSIGISMLLIICLYTLVNLAYLAVLSSSEMLESEAVAISMALKVWPPLAWIFSISIAITSISSANSGILVGSRMAFVGARNGHVPKVFNYISITRYTPVVSIVMQAFLGLFYIWVMQVDFIIQNLTFCHLAIELFISLAFIRIKLKAKRNHDKNGKIKFPVAFHIIFALTTFSLCFVSLVTKPLETTLVSSCIFLSTSILYLFFIKWKPSFLTNNQTIDACYRYLQIVFQSAPPDKEL